MRTRRFTWLRQIGRPPVATMIATDAPMPFSGTWEAHEGPALWDQGGAHVVVDTVPDLEWAVLDTRTGRRVQRVMLDFKEACNAAYDLDCAERRYKEQEWKP